MDKKKARLKRAAKGRAMIRGANTVRLTVHRTPRHIYAQVMTGDGSKVLAASSTLESEFKVEDKATGNIEAAKQVGSLIAQRALAAGVVSVAFDRSGFKYHGRIKALADSAREAGLLF